MPWRLHGYGGCREYSDIIDARIHEGDWRKRMSMDFTRTEANKSNGKRRHAPLSPLSRAKSIRKDERDRVDLVRTPLLISLSLPLLRLSSACFPPSQHIRPLHPAPPRVETTAPARAPPSPGRRRGASGRVRGARHPNSRRYAGCCAQEAPLRADLLGRGAC